MAPTAASGACMTPRPCLAMVRSLRTEPRFTGTPPWGRRATAKASAKSTVPTQTKTIRLEIAQSGIFAVSTT